MHGEKIEPHEPKSSVNQNAPKHERSAVLRLVHELMRQGRTAEARLVAGEFWPAEVETVPALVNMAKTAARLGEGELAVGLMMPAVELAPRDSGLHFEFGLLLAALGWRTEADREFLNAAGLVRDEERLEMADRLRTAGRLREAEGLYRCELDVDETCDRAWCGLALAAKADGLGAAALEMMERATDLEPENPVYRHELGLILLSRKNAADALVHLKKAAEQVPDDPNVLCNLGRAFAVGGDLRSALETFSAAREIDPLRPEIYNNIGNTLDLLGYGKESEAAYLEAVRLDPGYARAHYNLGRLYQNTSRLDKAAQSYRKALQAAPGHAESYNNLGTVYYAEGEWDRAADCYRKAQTLDPYNAQSFHNMANLLIKRSENPEAAIPYAGRAIELRPDYTEAAVTLLDLCSRTCTWNNLSEIEANARRLSQKDLETKGWSPENPLCAIRTSFDQAHHLAVARGWSQKMTEAAAKENIHFSFSRNNVHNGKLRLGYLSRDFRDHPVGHLIAGLFRLHDRKRFEAIAYSGGCDDGSSFRSDIERGCDRLVDVRGWTPREIARAVNDDGVDILIDLTGHSGGSMLPVCALRPAPIQVSYLGYLGSTGADFMDYFITDALVTPPQAAPFYTEKFVFMPHCYQINDHRLPISDTIYDREDFGLPESAFVYACFNGLGKIDPLLFDTWMNILTDVPKSVLWLYRGNSAAVSNLKIEAEKRGVDPQRLFFSGRLPLSEHLARLKLADLALDTRLYNGGATTGNALWTGLPVVTTLGRHFVSRMAAGALKAVGLHETIARDLDEYQELAIELANNPHKLEGLKAKLSQNRQTRPLFDTPRFVRDLERAYEKMWRSWKKRSKPESIELSDIE